MRGWLRRHLSYANAISTACLFLLLGGTAYAALTITGKNVKNGSLTGKDVKNGSLLRKDFKKGQLPAGAPGAPGAPGAAGASAPSGPAPTPVTQQLTLSRTGLPTISFPVLSTSFGAANPSTGGSGGGSGSGKASFEDLVVTKGPDANDADLLQMVADGTHFTSAQLAIHAPGASGSTLELGDTIVTGFASEGSGAGRTETVSLLVADPASIATNPPRLVWSPGAPPVPTGKPNAGEVTIAGIASTTAIVAHAWNVAQPGAGAIGGGGGSGKVVFQDFGVTKAIDSSSPALLKALKPGTPIASAEVRVFQPSTATTATRYVLSDVRVTGYHLTVGDGAQERLSLSYRKIEQYAPGPGGSELKTCWDLPGNKNCP
jgi:type VI protein secretion system component Hcp